MRRPLSPPHLESGGRGESAKKKEILVELWDYASTEVILKSICGVPKGIGHLPEVEERSKGAEE